MPSLAIIAGPHGAGKSTVAEFLLEAGGLGSFVNADDIERSLKRSPTVKTPIDAGRLLLAQVTNAISAGESIAFESTMSGRGWRKVILDARSKGFEVTICYVAVSSVTISLERVASRIAKGGHAIPIPTLQRRFPRSLHMFFTVYADLAHNWYFFDNSGTSARLLAMKEGAEATPRFLEKGLYERYRTEALGYR